MFVYRLVKLFLSCGTGLFLAISCAFQFSFSSKEPDIEHLRVTNVDIVDPDGDDIVLFNSSRFYPSPDGKKIAVFYARQICIFAANGDKLGCKFSAHLTLVDPRSVNWSPDSKKVIFTENFYTYLFEPDLWLLDIDAMSLKNITDDGIERYYLFDQNALIDVLPQWIEDGKKIAFLRVQLKEKENVLCWVDPVTGKVEEVIRLPYEFIDRIAFSRDDKTYAFIVQKGSNLSVYGGKFGNSTPELWFETKGAVVGLDFSADAKYLMIGVIVIDRLNVHLLEIESREEVQTLGQVQDGGEWIKLTKFSWAPAGSAFLYFEHNFDRREVSLFAGKPGKETHKIKVWREYPYGLTTLGDDQQPSISIPWCADNTLLLFNRAKSQLLRIYLEEE